MMNGVAHTNFICTWSLIWKLEAYVPCWDFVLAAAVKDSCSLNHFIHM